MNCLKELYRYRQMMKSFVKKELRGKYKGSVLGFLWTFINPLFQMLIYTIVFSVVLDIGIKNYYLFLFVALVPWIFFSSSLTNAATSILNNKEMVKKIYFPRAVLPIASVTTAFINMLLCFGVVLAVIIITGYGVNLPAFMTLFFVFMIEYILTLGVSFFTSAITVYFRDMEHILQIVNMAWMYLTPVLYSMDTIPEQYRGVFQYNPLTPIIQAYRVILYEKAIPDALLLIKPLAVSIAVFLLGFFTFQKLEKGFVEEL